MTTKKTFFALFLAAIIFVPFTTSAQITIGSGNEPSQWSLLDLDNREQEQPKALHLPRLDTEERRLLTESFTPNDKEAAKGLMIYRTDAISIGDNEYLGCLEFWNGAEWISMCETDYFGPGTGFVDCDIALLPAGVALANPPNALRRNQNFQLTLTVPDGVEVQQVRWVSSNPALATVNSAGIVHARAATGTVVVSAFIYIDGCRFRISRQFRLSV